MDVFSLLYFGLSRVWNEADAPNFVAWGPLGLNSPKGHRKAFSRTSTHAENVETFKERRYLLINDTRQGDSTTYQCTTCTFLRNNTDKQLQYIIQTVAGETTLVLLSINVRHSMGFLGRKKHIIDRHSVDEMRQNPDHTTTQYIQALIMHACIHQDPHRKQKTKSNESRVFPKKCNIRNIRKEVHTKCNKHHGTPATACSPMPNTCMYV